MTLCCSVCGARIADHPNNRAMDGSLICVPCQHVWPPETEDSPARGIALVRTDGTQLDTIGGQWWELSESGKRWELWGKCGKDSLRRLTYVKRSSVAWVIPLRMG